MGLRFRVSAWTACLWPPTRARQHLPASPAAAALLKATGLGEAEPARDRSPAEEQAAEPLLAAAGVGSEASMDYPPREWP